jgi:hypothetical protein
MSVSGKNCDSTGPAQKPSGAEAVRSRPSRGEERSMALACSTPAEPATRQGDAVTCPPFALVEIGAKQPSAPKEPALP